MRAVIEWGLYLCLGLFLSAVVLLIGSFFPAWPEDCLELHQDVSIQVFRGRMSLGGYVDYDSSGSPRFEVPDPKRIIVPGVKGSGALTVPGFALHYVRFGDGEPWWLVSFSLALPGALSLLASALLYRCLRKIHRLAREQGKREKVLTRSAV
jgi:hypothetical protein